MLRHLWIALCLTASPLSADTLAVAGNPILQDTGTGGATPTYKAAPDAEAIVTSDGHYLVYLDGQEIVFRDHRNNDALVTTGGIGGTGYPVAAKNLWQALAGFTFSNCVIPSCNSEPRIALLPSHTLGITNADGAVDTEDRIIIASSIGTPGSANYGTFVAVSRDLTHAADLSTWRGAFLTDPNFLTWRSNDSTPYIGFSDSTGVVIEYVLVNGSGTVNFTFAMFPWQQILFTSGGLGAFQSFETGEGGSSGAYVCEQAMEHVTTDLVCLRPNLGETTDSTPINFFTRHIGISGGVFSVSAASTLATGDTYYMVSGSSFPQPGGTAIAARNGWHTWTVRRLNGILYWTISTMQHAGGSGLAGIRWYTAAASTVVGNAPALLSKGSTFSSGTNIIGAQAGVDSRGYLYIVGSSSDTSNNFRMVAFWRAPADAAGTLRGPVTIQPGSVIATCSTTSPLRIIGLYSGVTQELSSPGRVLATGQAATNSGNCAWTAYTAELSVAGPAISAGPNPLFSTEMLNRTTPPQAITVQNTGSAVLNVSSISITGTDATQFSQTNNCGATLAINASCAITVTFTPTSAGTKSAAITVTDAVNLPNLLVAVPLSGRARSARRPQGL